MVLQDLVQFGATLVERKSEIEKKVDKPRYQHPIEFMGSPTKLPVINVRLGFPVYRLANGRTRTYQLEYLELNRALPKDFFTRDNDAVTAQLGQHDVLDRIVADEDLLKSFKEEEDQIQPLICTNTGVVVNGNRRLCAWRKLYLSNSITYKRFETIDIAILPECDESAIRDLERRLQVRKEKRAEYVWHTKAFMAQEDEQDGATHSDVAKAYDLSSQGLSNLIGEKDYAARYLEAIRKPNQWSLVDKDQYAFEKLVKNVRLFSDQGDKELFEALVFIQIEVGADPGAGRLYSVIDDLAENFKAIKNSVVEKNPIEPKPKGGPGKALEATTEDDINILAGETITEDPVSKTAADIMKSSNEGKTKIIKQVSNVIETEKAIKSELNATSYLLNQVSKAASLVSAAADQGLRENAIIDGVLDQLRTIREKADKIEEWVKTRQ